jgi:tRNA pseudouridine32 synthase/23S rRNA pseudouridine746 synthase
MLDGLDVETNPLLSQAGSEEQVKVIFEDEYIAIVNKAAEFLSVPGIVLTDSVKTRMKARYPDATGPLLVHRLDMSTSGILLIAKTEEAHKFLQRQFINRTIHKRYLAVLEGIVEKDEGEIILPMRVDLDDRPRQLICYEHGKYAKTTYKVLDRKDNKTRIHFFPHTGRTHQLRLHAAHMLLGSMRLSWVMIFMVKNLIVYICMPSGLVLSIRVQGSGWKWRWKQPFRKKVVIFLNQFRTVFHTYYISRRFLATT